MNWILLQAAARVFNLIFSSILIGLFKINVSLAKTKPNRSPNSGLHIPTSTAFLVAKSDNLDNKDEIR